MSNDTNNKNEKKETKHEVRDEIRHAAEGYEKLKKEIPQLGWGGVIGQKDMIRGLSDAFRNPFYMGKTTYSIIKNSFKRKERSPLHTDSNDPKERFSVAMETYNLSSEDIDERIKSSCFLFYLAFLGIFVDLGIYFYIAWTGHNIFPISVFPMLSLLFWLASQMFKYGLINFQMRSRALFPAKDYIKNNMNWFPPLNGKGKLATFMVIGLVGMSLATPALAGTSSTSISENCGVSEASAVSVENVLSIPCSKDLWLQSLARLFPGIGPLDSVHTGMTQTYGVGFVNALAAFVAIITAVAVGSLSYQSCIAVINTAVDGDTLGQKWHKVWAPVRICYGFGMLAPITKGGICMAQVFVLYIALWSGNWGSLVYRAYVDGIQNPSLNPNYTMPDTGATFSSLLRMNICWAFEKSVHDGNRSGDAWPEWSDINKPVSVSQLSNAVYSNGYGGQASMPSYPAGTTADTKVGAMAWNFGPCGILETPMRNYVSTSQSYVNAIAKHMPAWMHLYNSQGSSDQKAASFYTKRADLITALNNQIQAAVGPIVDSLYKEYDQQALLTGTDDTETQIAKGIADNGPLMSAYKTYNSSIISLEESTLSELSSSDEVKKAFDDTIRDNGWMVAGPYYMTISRMSGALSELVSKEPSPISSEGLSENISKDIQNMSQSGKGYMDKINKFINAITVEANPVDVNAAITGSRNDSATGVIGTRTDGETSIQPSVSSIKNAYNNGVTSDGFSPTGIKYVYAKKGIEDAFAYASNGLTNYCADHLSAMIAITPGDGSSMQQMINFGHKILDYVWGIIMFGLVIKTIGATIGAISTAVHVGKMILDFFTSEFGIGAADAVAETGPGLAISALVAKNAGYVGSKVIGLGIMLLLLGIVYAYIFPMLPYINFLFFEQGTMMLVAECMIATPILAYLHVRGEGEQLVDQVQKTGYMILFNLFLRIPLGVFGLIMSISIFETGVWLNAILFKIAFNGAIADNAAGFIGVAMYIALLVYIEWQLAIKSFSLISTLPQKISGWFGASADDRGEAAGMKEFLAFAAGGNLAGKLEGGVTKAIGSVYSSRDKGDGKGKGSSAKSTAADAVKAGMKKK